MIHADRFDAVVFDMDGVVTDTTDAHKTAWKEMFDEFLGPGAEPFDIWDDYLEYVDGKPRYDGVRSFLASRWIQLSEGDPDDLPSAETVCGLGNRKDRLFKAHLAEHGAVAYASTLRLIDSARRCGARTALITSSRNARAVLDAAAVGDVFDVVIDGTIAGERGIPGKPAPDVFVAAAYDLGVTCSRAVVVEDAASGVAAGAAGGFGLVIGVARAGNGAELLAAGADVVVSDLVAVEVGTVA